MKGLVELLHEASGAAHTAAFEADYNRDLNHIMSYVVKAQNALKEAERLLTTCSPNSNDCNWTSA
jgi:hypothetical protein